MLCAVGVLLHTSSHKICYIDSIIPEEPPTVAFLPGYGWCARGTQIFNIPELHREIIYLDILNEAGATVVEGLFGNVTVCNKCFENQTQLQLGYQVTQVPGHSQFSLKSNLAYTLRAFQKAHNLSLIPNTYLTPYELDELSAEMRRQNGGPAQKKFYIWKPVSSSRGRGIRLFSSVDELSSEERETFALA